MRDPENPNERGENLAEIPTRSIQLKSREETLLWTLRNSTDTLNRYGIGRKEDKYFILDRERLDKILERQPELREVLRKLWTDKI